jgi:hypothetical protein
MTSEKSDAIRARQILLEKARVYGEGINTKLLRSDYEMIPKEMKKILLRNAKIKGGVSRNNDWIDRVRKYAKKNNITYKEAMIRLKGT